MAFFREIRTGERITNRTNPQSFEYTKIKPETSMKENEAAEFWKKMFEEIKENEKILHEIVRETIEKEQT